MKRPAAARNRPSRPTLCVAVLALAVTGAASVSTAAESPGDGTTTVPPPSPAPAPMKAHVVNLTAKLRIKPQGAAFVGSGSASGTPFGSGRARLRSTVTRHAPLRTASTLTVVATKGTVVFKGPGRFAGPTFKATMKVFSGTGTYRGATGSNLAVTVVHRNGIDTLRLKGTVRYGLAPVVPPPVP